MSRRIAAMSLILTAVACGGEGEHEAPDAASLGIDCSSEAVPTFAQVTAFSNVCTNCHASTLVAQARSGAPNGYNFDLYERAADEAGEIAEYVSEGLMPPPGSGFTIDAEERSTLLRWAVCGTPR